MTTLSKERILQHRGNDLRGRAGDKIGGIEEIYLDAQTNEPEWALVNTGLFGTKRTFVPLREATEEDGALTVPYDKDTVKDAPQVEPNGQLTHREERELYGYYGIDYDPDQRSEPDPDVDEAAAETGPARLRKYPEGGST